MDVSPFVIPRNRKAIFVLIAEVIAVFTMTITAIVVHEIPNPNNEMMFLCNDPTLAFPYKPSTVNDMWLILYSMVGPLILIPLIEYCYVYRHSVELQRYVWTLRIAPWVWFAIAHFFIYMFGWGAVQLFTDVIKITIARPRPHFLAVCHPDLTLCQNGSVPVVASAVCRPLLGDFAEKYKDARLSFPSGHAANSFYAAVWITIYIESRLVGPGIWRLTRVVLHILVIALAIFITASRVFDYKHHSSDVFAGIVLGVVMAVLATVVQHREVFYGHRPGTASARCECGENYFPLDKRIARIRGYREDEGVDSTRDDDSATSTAAFNGGGNGL